MKFSALSGVLLSSVASGAAAASRPADDTTPLPQNPLGKTGVKVTRLGLGASVSDYDRRLLNYAYRPGIRYFDNADGYVGGKAEGLLGDWVSRSGQRNDVFVVTKSHAYDPESLYQSVVHSLEKMKIDTIDLYFIHALTQPEITSPWRRMASRERASPA